MSLTIGLAGLAQLAARQSHNLKVESSILSLRKRFFDFFNLSNFINLKHLFTQLLWGGGLRVHAYNYTGRGYG